MNRDFSDFGRQLGSGSGIESLMDDLGHALASGGPEVKMLGGGQPSQIPEVTEIWRRRLMELAQEPGGLERAFTQYDPPRGNPRFLAAVAGFFRRNFGWEIGPENVAVTAGGQTAFFFLFNLLAGSMPDGVRRHVLLPLTPEYIGYSNQGLSAGHFRAAPPHIEKTGPHEFKYRVDFSQVEVLPETAAICASRPTNPTGNVLTDDEVARLAALARAQGVPLILDNAYGAPFPGIIFEEVTPYWDNNTVLTLSLSKIGLPGARTGIVIGPEEIIRALGSLSAIVGLANPGAGQQLVLPLLESDEILRLSREVVRPFYHRRCQLARAAALEEFGDGFEWYMHRSEGALFLWFWFPGLPITVRELYERLKKRGVLVIAGDYFFFGDHREDWRHRQECIRVTYSMDMDVVRQGLRIIGEEVRRAHQAG